MKEEKAVVRVDWKEVGRGVAGGQEESKRA